MGALVIYGSVCSGIEGASVAWEPLGWRPAWFAEIDPFACAVLRHRWPEVPNLGDFTLIGKEVPCAAIDVLVGGTPCQAFSVAGLRAGLADPRGNLTLEFLALADRVRPRWILWENVPGVLSSLSDDAPCPDTPPTPVDVELDGQELVSEDEHDIEEVHAFNCFLAGLSELGYGWAYWVPDAQYFGLAQRRARVFVVGHLGAWQPAAAVLPDRSSMRWDPPPSRTAGEGTARPLGSCPQGGSGYRNDADTADNLVARPLTAPGGGYRSANTLSASYAKTVDRAGSKGNGPINIVVDQAIPIQDSTHVNKGQGGDGIGRAGDPMYTLQAGVQSGVAISIQERAVSENPDAGPDGVGVSDEGVAYTLEARERVQAVAAWDERNITSPGNRSSVTPGAPCHTLHDVPPAIVSPMAVRRLTPRECERLQGFPDDYTLVPVRGGAAADGPRYRALGNSFPVPVVRWIGKRIAAVDAALAARREQSA